METKEQLKAPVVAVARHRMQIDGPGVTTLVCFHGCPLRCRWCINPFTFAPDTKRTIMTPAMLYEQVRVDDLYFRATGGGVTFGGGEPLLQPAFLREFRSICGNDWHLCVETSLWVRWENVEMAADSMDMFYVDCKDTDPAIYRSYTGQDNARMLENLKRLLHLVGPDRITVRLPLIPGYNTEENRQKSKELLTQMGITRFDLLTYKTNEE